MLAVAATPVVTAKLIAIQPDLAFPEKGGEIVRTYNGIDPKLSFDQVVASWNVQPADGAAITIEVRVHGDGFDSGWYTMGKWSLDGKSAPRESVNGQKDAYGKVDTDTLMLSKPATSADLRLVLSSTSDAIAAKLKFVTLSFSGPLAPEADETSNPAWGKTLVVPERAQGNYPGGADKWCSPTSTSMLLAHWSRVLKQPNLDHDVPEVQSHVYDPIFDGAGNWPFNTAYVGSFPGMRAYVCRMNGLAEAEAWIDKGIPIACSVAYSLTKGLPLSSNEQGHLMVLIGFTKDGDPIFNDPAHKEQVQKTFKRADFLKGWEYSRRTTYIVYAEGTDVPTQ